MKYFFFLLLIIGMHRYSAAQDSTAIDDRWDDRFTSTRHISTPGLSVLSTAVLNNDLYIGGAFTGMYEGIDLDQSLKYLVRWDGQNYSVVGEGVDNIITRVTNIPYRIEKPVYVRIDLYDVLGRKVRSLISAYHLPGENTVLFESGTLPSGTYVYRLQADDGEWRDQLMTIIQ